MKTPHFWQQTDKRSKTLVLLAAIFLISFVGLWLTDTSSPETIQTDAEQTKQLAQAQTSLPDDSQSSTTQKTKDVNSSTAQSTSTQKDKFESKQSPDPPSKKNPFADVSIEAESAVVWDIRKNAPIYTKNAEKEQPLASLTKLMTAVVATQEFTGEATTTISASHLDAFGKYGLKEHQTWSLQNLISFMLVESANDAARAVAAVGGNNTEKGYAKEFVEKMNDTASQLGLSDTYFFNPSGLDINEDLISGGYGTALDTVQLFAYIQQHYPDILQPTTQQNMQIPASNGTVYTAENTNELIGALPDVTGSKTGYTVLAGGNLVMSFDYKRPIVIAVLGSTKTGRFTDMKTLYQKARDYAARKSHETTANTTNDR